MSIENSTIIVSYNNSKVLQQTILSLLEYLPSKKHEIIVVDNFSSENNVEMIKREFPQIIIIENKKNLGFGRANNQGAKIANGKYLFFVNGDIILSGNPFTEMLEFYTKTINIGLLGAQLLNVDLSQQPSHYNFPSITRRVIELAGLKKWIKKFYSTYKNANKAFIKVEAIKGAFFLVSKDNFNLFGLFDEFYFMYVEDVDLSYQSIEKGHQNYLYNNDKIVHLGENHESVENIFLFEHRNRGVIHFYKRNYSSSKFYIFVGINLTFFLLKFLKSWLLNNKIKQHNYKIILKLYRKAL